MTNKKRARENQRRREAELARKRAEIAAVRAARARRVWAIVGIALGAAAIVGLALVLFHAKSQPDAVPSLSATPTSSAGATAEPTAEADGDGSDPDPSATETDPGIELAEGWGSSPAPPDPTYAEARDWVAVLDTNQGAITVTLDGAAAPQATAAFIKLAGDGFYDETDCRRIVTGGPYLLQCGTASGTGAPQASFTFGPLENVPKNGIYQAGDVVMVRSADDADSMSSQFQIIWKDSTLPTDGAGGYTVVGKVTDGLSIVEGIAQAGTITGDTDGWPAVSLIINEVTIQ